MEKITLVLQRPRDDEGGMQLLECYECEWYTSYDDLLWTSNKRPDDMDRAFIDCATHTREVHGTRCRIVRSWKP